MPLSRSKKVRVAVIGAGNMGRHHVRNYAMLQDAELIAVADVDLKSESLAKEHKAQFFTDHRKLITDLNPDAVSIVVPTPFHHDVATFCLNAGVHCLIEKPVASTVKEADALISLANKKGLVLTVGHIERYNPLIRKIRDLVGNNAVGDITSIICQRVGGFPTVEPKTDVIIDLAVHDIDIINSFIKDVPKKITSHGSRTHHSKEIDSAEILMDYGYASGFIQTNWLTPVKIRTISITGSGGYLQGNYITQELVHYRHNMKDERDGFNKFVVKMGEPEKEIIDVDFEEPLAVELKNFINAVQGEETPELVDPVDAREALRLALEAIAPLKEKA